GDNRSNWAANGFDIYAPGGPTVKQYNSATGGWVGINSTADPIKNAGGYMTFIRSDRSGTLSSTTLRSAGELYAGTQPVINIPANQFKVIGNPFAAPVSIASIKKQGLQDVIYVWDPKLGGGYGLGAFQTIINMGDEYVVFPGGGSYGPQLSAVNTIESGQAFFVKALGTGGSIQFEEANKQIGSRMVFKTISSLTTTLRATLYSVATDTTTLLDAAMINFDNAFSNNVDENDLTKFTNGSENVSIKRGSSLLVADRRPMPAAQDTVVLNVTGVRVQRYKWVINADHFASNGQAAFLRDAYANTLTALNLAGTTEYEFSMVNIPAAYAANRFSIVFERAVVLPVNISSVAAVRNRQVSSQANIYWKVENETGIAGYEIEHSAEGRNFKTITTTQPTAQGSQHQYEASHNNALAADNFYRVKAISFSGLIQYSAVVKVAATNSNAAIEVYPNPVAGKQMNVQYNAVAAGKYQLQLINAAGQVEFATTENISSASMVRTVNISGVAAGNYTLRVHGPAEASYTIPVIVL
ncbi:MAG: T9SS type A sorting domain-containing protein, partial [Sphingobacteriales bacterium]